MKKILFVVPPFTGHTLPNASLAADLSLRGYSVYWAGEGRYKSYLDDTIHFLELPSLSEGGVGGSITRGFDGIKILFEELIIPSTRYLFDFFTDIVERIKPDLLIVDQLFILGALVARKTGIPWVTTCTTPASLIRESDMFPKFLQEYKELLSRLEDEYDLERLPGFPDSPHLSIVFSVEKFFGSQRQLSSNYKFAGPAIKHRFDSPSDFPWEEIQDLPVIYITLGTVRDNKQGFERFIKAAAEALHDFDGKVVVSVDDDFAGDLPNNFIVRRYVPQLDLLKKTKLVICHGGYNTVCETLAHGIPLVVAPIRHDQPIIAHMVKECGVGLTVRYGIINAKALKSAVDKVLHNPEFIQNAKAMQQELLAFDDSYPCSLVENFVTQSLCA